MDHNDDEECPVCMEPILPPKSLVCGHSICAKCEVQLKINNKIDCPTCRKSTPVPLSGLPTNFALKHIIEKERARKLKDVEITAKRGACTVCDKRMGFEDCWRCKTCSNMILCAQCSFKDHRDHTLMDLPSIIQHNKQLVEDWYTSNLNKCVVAANRDQAQYTDLKKELNEVTKVVLDLCAGAQAECCAHHSQIQQGLHEFKESLLPEFEHESIMIEANDLDYKLEQNIGQYRGKHETIPNKIGDLQEILSLLKYNVGQFQSCYGDASNQSDRQRIDFIGSALAGRNSSIMQVFVKHNEQEFGFQVDSNSTVLSLLKKFYAKAGIKNKPAGYGLIYAGILLEDNKLIRDYPMVSDRAVLQFRILAIAINEPSEIKLKNIVVIGGNDGKDRLDGIYEYDPAIGCPSTTLNVKMSTKRSSHSCGLSNSRGDIIVAGGFDGESYLKSVECINTITGETGSLPDMAFERSGSASCVIGNKFIVIGGYNRKDCMQSCECLDLYKKTRSNIAPLPVPLFSSSAIPFREDNQDQSAFIPERFQMYIGLDFARKMHQTLQSVSNVERHRNNQDTILLIGGAPNFSLYTFSDKVYQYNLVSDSWRERPEWRLPTPIRRSGLVMWRGRPVMCGGLSSDRITLSKCYALDLKNGGWEELAPLNVARYSHQTVVYGDDIIVMGGRDANNEALKSVELYDGNKWVFKKNLDTPVTEFSAIVL